MAKGKTASSDWSVADSRRVYGIRHWGAGYFAINEAGNVEVRPQGPDGMPIDLYDLVGQLRASGLSLPLLVRFPGILQDRVRQLTGAFDANIARLGYGNRYTALYPIKVNQQEAVVENIIATDNVAIGLEAGSKPELMAVLALAPKGGTIVCNGYKDREFIRLALIGQKLGHSLFIVIEKESEVALVIEEAEALGVAPQIGLRVRLSSLASSKWADTGGEKSKFGLSAAQLLAVVERFRAAGLDQGIRLLHFHMGSQIANIA
ncbi:MAG: arginine decarboxylase, partial [Pseudomonas sp.]|nr:arginine decarboxylase [Pseudomonas sp.]